MCFGHIRRDGAVEAGQDFCNGYPPIRRWHPTVKSIAYAVLAAIVAAMPCRPAAAASGAAREQVFAAAPLSWEPDPVDPQ